MFAPNWFTSPCTSPTSFRLLVSLRLWVFSGLRNVIGSADGWPVIVANSVSESPTQASTRCGRIFIDRSSWTEERLTDRANTQSRAMDTSPRAGWLTGRDGRTVDRSGRRSQLTRRSVCVLLSARRLSLPPLRLRSVGHQRPAPGCPRRGDRTIQRSRRVGAAASPRTADAPAAA